VTHAAYVFFGYAATTAVLAAYAGWVVSRRRALARLVPPDGRGAGGRPSPGTPPPTQT
jgi:hypothetical protein